jgi:hypothetical protein
MSIITRVHSIGSCPKVNNDQAQLHPVAQSIALGSSFAAILGPFNFYPFCTRVRLFTFTHLLIFTHKINPLLPYVLCIWTNKIWNLTSPDKRKRRTLEHVRMDNGETRWKGSDYAWDGVRCEVTWMHIQRDYFVVASGLRKGGRKIKVVEGRLDFSSRCRTGKNGEY